MPARSIAVGAAAAAAAAVVAIEAAVHHSFSLFLRTVSWLAHTVYSAPHYYCILLHSRVELRALVCCHCATSQWRRACPIMNDQQDLIHCLETERSLSPNGNQNLNLLRDQPNKPFLAATSSGSNTAVCSEIKLKFSIPKQSALSLPSNATRLQYSNFFYNYCILYTSD